MRYIICLLVCLFILVPYIHAQTLSDADKRIAELEAKINELQSAESSLGQKIKLFDSQITLTTLNIQSTKERIVKLAQEADELSNEINRLESLLTRQSELVLRRIPESYKRNLIYSIQYPTILFSSNISDLVNRSKYISTVQSYDAKNLLLLKKTQNNFSERKQLRQDKIVQQQSLQKQLESENIQLVSQKREKKLLLDETKNSESVYQQLLAQALAEKKAVDAALITGVTVGPVKRGDPIALVGNSGYPGCSTGAHLHFEIRKNNAWVDPSGYLSNKTVIDDQNGGTWNVGSGDWGWPLTDPVRITQHFGKTPYSWRYAYSGGIHTGFDMVSTGSQVIIAPKDGILYSSSEACGSSSVIKIKYIDHGDGVISFYLHVQ